jgi:hypothetical protein
MLDPEYTHAFNNRGTVYFKLKQFEKAIQDSISNAATDKSIGIFWI